ncbi:hypothetical protein D3C80_1649190 [compost metagenome]
MIPSVLRSSGQKPNPAVIAASGEERAMVFPSIVALPVSGLSMPNSRKAVSVRPDPKRPATPTISPGRMPRSKGAMLPRLPYPSKRIGGSPSATVSSVA